MITIYKYPLRPREEAMEIKIPRKKKIISAGLDPLGQVCIWAIVNDETPLETVRFYCVGTEWPLEWMLNNDSVKFIGTVKQHHLMWHIFQGVDK